MGKGGAKSGKKSDKSRTRSRTKRPPEIPAAPLALQKAHIAPRRAAKEPTEQLPHAALSLLAIPIAARPPIVANFPRSTIRDGKWTGAKATNAKNAVMQPMADVRQCWPKSFVRRSGITAGPPDATETGQSARREPAGARR